jgi:cell division protein FtsL
MGRAATARAPATRRVRSAPAKRHGGRRRQAAPRRSVRSAAARPRGARILDALLTGRACIAVVGVLLAGIVFFNVDLLQMNRDITHTADRAAQLKRENARLRVDVARLSSSERIQESAAGLGLVYPAPGEVRYLKSRPPVDARNASKHMSAPDPTYVAPAPTPTTSSEPPGTTDPTGSATGPAEEAADPTTATPNTGPVDPATGLPVDPATGRTPYSPTGQPLDPATGLPLDPSSG